MAINFTKGMSSSIPADDTNMSTALSGAEHTALQADDNSYVEQLGSTADNAIMLFKETFPLDSTSISRTWKGKSSLPCTQGALYLQVYNRTLGAWETYDANCIEPADTEFSVTANITSGISDYLDAQGYAAFRIMQAIEKESPVWTLGFIPDSQYLISLRPGDLRANDQWVDLAEYLVSLETEKNIQMVLHSGDVINGGSNGVYAESSWNLAGTGVNTFLNNNFPILWGVGCHDYDNDFDATATRGITKMQAWITKTKYDTYSWFGASTYPAGTMRNTYGIKTINGEKWMFLTFEMYPPTGAITWANGVIASEAPDFIVMVTNGYLEPDGTLGQWDDPYGPAEQGTTITEGQANVYYGQKFWDDFVSQHQEIVLVLSAHTFDDNATVTEPTNVGKVSHAYKQNTHANGNICTQIITNFQEEKLYKRPWESGKSYIAYASQANQWQVEVSHPGANGETDDWNYYYRCKLSHTSSASTKPEDGANWATYWDKIAWNGAGLCGTVVFFEINSDTRTITRYDYHPISGISPQNHPKDNYPTQDPDWKSKHSFTFKY